MDFKLTGAGLCWAGLPFVLGWVELRLRLKFGFEIGSAPSRAHK